MDDSIGQGSEEEEVFYGEEEEENFNHISNQGKLTIATCYGKLIRATLVIQMTHDQASYTCKITPLRPKSQFYCKLSFYFFIKDRYLEYLENCRIVVEGSIKSIKLGLVRIT